jgi:hypothetical protein
MHIDAEMPLINLNCPTHPLNCHHCYLDVAVFPMRHPCPNDLHVVCRSIERRLLPHINHVLKKYEDKFVHHNVTHKLCNQHIDDIKVLLLFNHLKLALLKEDQDDVILGY